MAELRINLLGIPEIALDGAVVQLRRRSSLALLAYLALSNRPHTRDELAALLSGDVAEGQARKLLRNALTDLGEHGLYDFLATNRQTIAFNPTAPYTLDIERLRELEAVETVIETEPFEWAAARCDWELLDGVTIRDAPMFEAWLSLERQYVRRQLTRVTHQLLAHYWREGAAEAGIPLARRLIAIEPWQESTHRLLMHLLTIGGQRTAALRHYEQFRQNLAESVGVDPEPETADLYQTIRAGQSGPLPANPPPLAPLVGRARELEELVQAISDPACRLLTLVGIGGGGKTQLARAAASTLALDDRHRFPDGIFIVNLEEVASLDEGQGVLGTSANRIVTAISRELGIAFHGPVGRLDRLIAYLQGKRLLLILDDIEHFLDGAGVLQTMLHRAPGLTLLATSRTRLALPEEQVREVGGLALPESPEHLDQSPAGQLFLREARRLNARILPDDYLQISRICELTAGLPLSLVITAGWLRALSCQEIVQELERAGPLLAEPTPNHPARHRSIRAIITSTWKGLALREQQALRRLSVFRGRFDRQAAEAISVGSPSLLALCEQSLVERGADGYYLMHPLVRQYGAEQLARRPAEMSQVRARQAAHYGALLARHAPLLYQQPDAYALIGLEYVNILTAWEWATETADAALLLRLSEGMELWHQMAGLHREWAEALDDAVSGLRTALDRGDDPELRATIGWLLVAEAEALHWQGQLDRAYPLLEETRQHARTLGAIPLEARISLYEGRLLHFQGNSQAGAELLRQAANLARATQNRRLEVDSLLALSFAAADTGNHIEAESVLTSAEHACHRIGDRLSFGRITLHRGRLVGIQGDFTRAKIYLEQSIQLATAFNDRPAEGWANAHRGLACGPGLGQHTEAERSFDTALAIAQEVCDVNLEAFSRWARGRNALQSGDFERACGDFEETLTAGQRMGSAAVSSRALLGLGQLAYLWGDAPTAEERVQQALRLALDSGRRQERTAALLLLGQIQERLGLEDEAEASYRQTLALARELAMPYLCCDAVAGLASVALAGGRLAEAVTHASAVLTYAEEQSLSGCDEPGWAALTSYRALETAADARADDIARLGGGLLQRRAENLPAGQRQQYIDAFAARRELVHQFVERNQPKRRSTDPARSLPLDAAYGAPEDVLHQHSVTGSNGSKRAAAQ
jgi:DNA-binding SARP family transcriptional activator/predicted ATPase